MNATVNAPLDPSSQGAEEPNARSPQLDRFPPVGRVELGQLAKLFETLLERAREAALEPAKTKKLRTWNGTEVAALLGMTDDALRRRLKKDLADREDPQRALALADTAPLPQGTLKNGRRHFALEEIHALQAALWPRSKRDPEHDDPLILSISNFKGGVAKTTTTLHLAQWLVLHGYRVLLLDLDAQATLTQQFGFLPHMDVDESRTALALFESDLPEDQLPEILAQGAISSTHWHNLDLLCANLALYGADFSLTSRLTREQTFRFYKVLAKGLEKIKKNYDLIILDTAPSLSFVNANALFAIDALVVTMPPAPYDLQSGGLFFRWLEQLAKLFSEAEVNEKVYDFVALLITKMRNAPVEPKMSGTREKPQAGKKNVYTDEIIRGWLQTYFPQFLVTTPVAESQAIQRLSQSITTLYEAEKYEGDKRTFQRAIASMNGAYAELETAIQLTWQRRREARSHTANGASATVTAGVT